MSTAIKSLEAGEMVDHAQLRPLLTLGPKKDRYYVNLRLAAAYYDRYERLNDQQSLQYAKSCIDRALLLSRYSVDVLPLLVQINQALADVDAIRDAFKRTGIEAASRGKFDEALTLFDRWLSANAEFKRNDIHTFDADVIACVERMGALHRFSPRNTATENRKLRVAYLTHGLRQPGSVLVKIDRVFARLHDKSRFDIAYFAVDNPNDLSSSPDAQTAIADFRDSGCQFFVPPEKETTYERLLGVGQQIHDFGADVLVTSAALATFQNYLIASLRPAPVTIAFNQGSTPQFSWHSFDHTINWFLTTLPDCPSDCSHVPLELELPRKGEITPELHGQFTIPAGATILTTGGRWHKFQRPEFWHVMSELLTELPDLYWLVLGFDEDEVPFLNDIVTPEARQKIRFKNWGPDYLTYLAAADFVVDSYPMGGGVFLMEAMSMGLPVLSFHHDYVAYYRNDDCSGGEEIVGIEDLLIERSNFNELKQRIAMLVRDPDRRREFGEQCRRRVQENHSQPERMVQRCENIFECLHRERRARIQADGASPSGNSHESGFDEYKLLLLEQATILNNREGEIRRQEAQLNRHPLIKVIRHLRGGLHRLRVR
ncbi:MAG TPA: hypothetical protein VJ875_23785 [Pyrinomonadaceae bacterium]|nr:hypothetical protein [Pyrinomonadaceae bacterium]